MQKGVVDDEPDGMVIGAVGASLPRSFFFPSPPAALAKDRLGQYLLAPVV